MKNSVISIILGVLAIIAGFIALANPLKASLGAEIFTAWLFLIVGVGTIIGAFMGEQSNSRLWTIIVGVLMILIGWVLLNNPIKGIMTLSWAAAILLFASGLVKFFYGFRVRSTMMKILTIISGALSILVAILVFNNPFLSLGILLGIELIGDGVAIIALGVARNQGGVAGA